MNHNNTLQEDIVHFAKKIGFHLVGFTTPYVDNETKERFLRWIKENKHAGLWYLEEKRRLIMRFHPEKLMDGVKSIIVFGVSYKDNLFTRRVPSDRGYISLYALRRDYHRVMKKKLKKVVEFIQEHESGLKARIFVDSAPILERYFAYKAGIGFIGKNNFIINPIIGGLIFLGEIFTNLEFKVSEPLSQSCAGCSLCIDACPTGALKPFELNLNLCISYHTIENKGIVPLFVANNMKNRIFGCDECAIACPYNKKQNNIQPFFNEDSLEHLQGIPLEELVKMTEEDFNNIFKGTPVKRAGYEVFMRNVIIAIYNSKKEHLFKLAREQCQKSTSILIRKTCKKMGLLD